jgi:predicted Zn-dependent protease
VGGGAPPEFMSTHPSSSTRMSDLQSHMSQALQLYKAAPEKPNCK